MFPNHAGMVLTQIGIGLVFTGLYFVVFHQLILRLNLKTPGREDSEVRLYNKADYRAARHASASSDGQNPQHDQVRGFLHALGGASNIANINNCATRLRITLVDEAKTQNDAAFMALGAHGVVRRGNGIQVIVGLQVPQVREQLESQMKDQAESEATPSMEKPL